VTVNRFDSSSSNASITISNVKEIEENLMTSSTYYISVIVTVSAVGVIVIIVLACIFVRYKRSYLTF